MADTYEFAEIAVVRAVLDEDEEAAAEKLAGFTRNELYQLNAVLGTVMDLVAKEIQRLPEERG